MLTLKATYSEGEFRGWGGRWGVDEGDGVDGEGWGKGREEVGVVCQSSGPGGEAWSNKSYVPTPRPLH